MSQQEIKSIRVLIVDDHEVVRIGLRSLLARAESICVVGEAETSADAVAKANRLKPDVVLMDVRLPDGSGVECCREIRSSNPDTKVLFLTSFADEDAIANAMLGGAHGYLLKEIRGETLLRAIKMVASGHSILDPAATEFLIAQMRACSNQGVNEHDELTGQEERVLALVAEGKTNKEIAAVLNVSEKTIKNYLTHIFQKLQVTRRSQAVASFFRKSIA